MKIVKWIVPIMALTILNNQATAMRFEKEIDAPYETLLRERENYFANQQNNPNILEEIGGAEMPISYSEAGCEALYRSIMDTCNALTGAKRVACQIAAHATYLACLSGPGGSERVFINA